MLEVSKKGPPTPLAEAIHKEKYRMDGESFEQAMYRIANALQDGDDHYNKLKDILLDMRFLPGGRVQSAVGSPRLVTAYNCFVSGIIEDNSDSIMQRATEAFKTMRRGGGIGYDFSRIRPRGDRIQSLDSRASGPISFMGIYNAVCNTVCSAGHRRGAQMGVLRVDHPDVEEFIRAKQNTDNLTAFNISLGVTDRFMDALLSGERFPLTFKGETYRTINPQHLWEEVMRSTWDWAEPGVLFIDTINEYNNLYYCERIEATNPCAEQPLPPYGACLLGSFNLTKYADWSSVIGDGTKPMVPRFRWDLLREDIPNVVRAMDNVIDRTIYPLIEQEREAKNKRRMGLGVLGLANVGESLGYPYGSRGFLGFEAQVLEFINEECYSASIELAREKGSFPLYTHEYLSGGFIRTLPDSVLSGIIAHGIRNSHLTSIAPTGTIHNTAGCVSSGIEPPYSLEYDRDIAEFDGIKTYRAVDYAYKFWGVKGKTAEQVTVDEHLSVLSTAQKYVDSAVSKTCNCGPDVSYHQFKEIYLRAWKDKCKGISTFRSDGKRMGILRATETEEKEAEACYIDPQTGEKSCG
jgi:ribonucleoside-diphosphate reductase alpha chain